MEEQAVREAVWEEECRRQREEARWHLEMLIIVIINMVIIIIQVANATNAVANVDDYSGSARLLAATTLRS